MKILPYKYRVSFIYLILVLTVVLYEISILIIPNSTRYILRFIFLSPFIDYLWFYNSKSFFFFSFILIISPVITYKYKTFLLFTCILLTAYLRSWLCGAYFIHLSRYLHLGSSFIILDQLQLLVHSFKYIRLWALILISAWNPALLSTITI